MPADRLFSLVLALALLLGPTLRGDALRPRVTTSVTGPDSVVQWNRIARRTAITVAALPAAHSLIYISYAQAAVYNAVAAIAGGYQQYEANLARRPGASIDAAVATAAHDVLAHHFQAQQAALDADYATALAAIPDGDAKTAGVDVGRQAADAIIALRQNDGLEADIGFAMPAPGPGVWQLPPPQGPQTPWVSKLRPFLIKSPDQFRPGPPPALTSAEWAAEFNEVKTMGRLDSTYRTAQQTATALFWSVNPIIQSNTTLENIALTRGLDAMQAARLFAMGTLVGADALISCWDAKYTYLFWRPAFAIPQADIDGNPDTVADVTWRPLLPTPNHPEYPSAHGCMTSSQAEVFSAFFGTNRINIDIFATLNGRIVTHHFDRVVDLRQEISTARVWGGLHYRQSMVQGINTGRKVAHYALSRYFLPEN